MMTTKGFLIAFTLVALLQTPTPYRVVNRYPIPGIGGFDYVTIDSKERRLYVSHGTQVEVLDADSGKLVGTIADTPGVHGAVVASESKHGFTSNGRENKVSMFDPSTLQLIKKIEVGKGRTVSYDERTKRVFKTITDHVMCRLLMPHLVTSLAR
jgi:DNA-binding beta-propeller fold protein YncE